MYATKLLALIALCTTPVITKSVSNKVKFFETWNDITEGLFGLDNIISSFHGIFSILTDDGNTNNGNKNVPEDAYLNITQLATKYGYNIETHKVITEDGYILNVHRLPGRGAKQNNIVVFLMHGIIDSSDSWLLQGPNYSLAYILADQGYDVWMGNARGNKHANKHVTLNITDSDFWEFTWEEIGMYDITSMIDYALNATGNESLYYVGHSQGTTSFYVMSSMKPEYNKKVKMMFSLAPEAWLGHVKSPLLKMFSPASKILGYLSDINTNASIKDFLSNLAEVLCNFLNINCGNIEFMAVGQDYKYINESIRPIIEGHTPTASSTAQFIHYGQLVSSGRFCRYDFDEEKNMELYGDVTPPDYNVSDITVPIVLFYSGNDWLSTPADVRILKEKLPNVINEHYLNDYNHLDYLYAFNAKDYIYYHIVSYIYDFENQKL